MVLLPKRATGATAQKTVLSPTGSGRCGEAATPYRQSKVRLDRPIKLSAGIEHQEMGTTSVPVARTIPPFHASRCTTRMKTQWISTDVTLTAPQIVICPSQ